MAIHYCRHCGAIIPYGNSNCCHNCAQKRADEQRWRESSKEVRPNAAGAELLKALAKPLLKLLKIFGVFLIISAVIWVILFFVYDVYKIDYSVVDESTRTVDGFASFLLDMDNNRDTWEVQYEIKNAGMFSRLAFWDKASCTIRYNKGTNAPYTTFIFEGENLGTKLPDGTYVLTKIKGVDVLIDKNNKLIYKADSEFYKTNAPILGEFAHDALIDKILKETEGGEHGLIGTNPPTEAIFTEKAAITARLVRNNPNALMDHGFEARCRIGDSNEWEVYKFTYNYSNAVYDFNIDGYTYAE